METKLSAKPSMAKSSSLTETKRLNKTTAKKANQNKTMVRKATARKSKRKAKAKRITGSRMAKKTTVMKRTRSSIEGAWLERNSDAM